MKLLDNKIIFCFAIILSIIYQTKAQNNYNFSEGTVKYKIKTEGTGGLIEEICATTVLNVSIKGEKMKIDIDFLNGLARVQIISDINTNSNTLLLDIPMIADGVAVNLGAFDVLLETVLDNGKPINKTPQKEAIQITYNKGKKKKIAKYRCYASSITVAESEQEAMRAYVTDKIRSKTLEVFQKKVFKNMKGFPLGFFVETADMKFQIIAEQIQRKKISKDIFEIPNYYENQSLTDFIQEIKEKLDSDDLIKGL